MPSPISNWFTGEDTIEATNFLNLYAPFACASLRRQRPHAITTALAA
jgi:hypothetical protein